MGFALWIEGDTAECAGTHEYRPLGAAVISAMGQFTAADFRPVRRQPARPAEYFQGYFASLVAVNHHLRSRPVTDRKKKYRRRRGLIIPTF